MSNGRAPDHEHRGDKRALFLLAALVVCVLGTIVAGVFFTKTVPDKGDVLLGGIATGLILFLQRLVDAVRSSWDAVTQSKTMDTLAGSAPAGGTGNGASAPSGTADDPTHTVVDNTTAKPVPTTTKGTKV